MIVLSIYQRTSPEERAQLFPKDSEYPEGMIQEGREYVLEFAGSDNPDTVELLIGDSRLDALRSRDGVARWRWTPGFYAGVIELVVRDPGGVLIETELITDPSRAKLTRDDFDTMLRDILEDTLSLFSLSEFRTKVSRGTGADVPPLSRLEFLRSRIDEIEKVVLSIDNQPLRTLRPRHDELLPHQIRDLSMRDLQVSYASGKLKRLHPNLPFTKRVSEYFPEKVRSTRKVIAMDIREHRMIRTCLNTWRAWLFVVAERLSKSDSDDEESRTAAAVWARRCRVMSRRLGKLLQLPMFEELNAAPMRMEVTSVFRRVVNYRRFFMLWRDMNLGIARVDGDFLGMPLARTFDLYEIWAYLRILRALISRFDLANVDPTAMFSREPARDGVAFIRNASLVQLSPHAALAFKREYREFWIEDDRLGSFSRTMVPDLSVRVNGKIIVLDAKYRIEAQLNDAISSLHTYRDAILAESADGGHSQVVAGAFLLTPHVPSGNAHWRIPSNMPGRLFHPEYNSIFRFGAVTLRPGMSLESIADVMERVFSDSGVTHL
ncbi:MAG: DUF2357 domain-containing protein [Planctomycetaceae bacterium]